MTRKDYVIQLTITMIAGYGGAEENAQFHFEENGCVDNLIDQLHRESEEADELSTCACCKRSDVKLLREANEEDIRKYGFSKERASEIGVTP